VNAFGRKNVQNGDGSVSVCGSIRIRHTYKAVVLLYYRRNRRNISSSRSSSSSQWVCAKKNRCDDTLECLTVAFPIYSLLLYTTTMNRKSFLVFQYYYYSRLYSVL